MININYKDSRPIYEQVKAGFIRLITTGVMAEDEKLPSVRELAAGLAINPNTIQKAYAQLEAEGYIYSVSGKGSFASPGKGVMDKRRTELFSELERNVLGLKELSVGIEDIEKAIKKIYREKTGKGGTYSDKS